jgi:hypothetical protein
MRVPCFRPFQVPEWVGTLQADVGKRDDVIRLLITDPVLQKRDRNPEVTSATVDIEPPAFSSAFTYFSNSNANKLAFSG